jgi:hypothetical protein
MLPYQDNDILKAYKAIVWDILITRGRKKTRNIWIDFLLHR